MPIPVSTLVKIFEITVRTARTGFRGNQLIRKVETFKIGKYFVETTRRDQLGADKAISQVIRIFKNNKTEEI